MATAVEARLPSTTHRKQQRGFNAALADGEAQAPGEAESTYRRAGRMRLEQRHMLKAADDGAPAATRASRTRMVKISIQGSDSRN
jgi:hypothetical protein